MAMPKAIKTGVRGGSSRYTTDDINLNVIQTRGDDIMVAYIEQVMEDNACSKSEAVRMLLELGIARYKEVSDRIPKARSKTAKD